MSGQSVGAERRFGERCEGPWVTQAGLAEGPLSQRYLHPAPLPRRRSMSRLHPREDFSRYARWLELWTPLACPRRNDGRAPQPVRPPGVGPRHAGRGLRAPVRLLRGQAAARVLPAHAASVGAFFAGLMPTLGLLGSLIASVVAFVGVVRGTRASWRASRARLPVFGSVLAAIGSLVMVLVGFLSAFAGLASSRVAGSCAGSGASSCRPCAGEERGRRWAWGRLTASSPSSSARSGGRTAGTEHASVAAFARLTLDLLALGAPPELLASAQRDALDEIRHTELCFSLARAIDGKSESPGPFAEASRARTLPRTLSLALAKLAVDSLVDGALHEGVSARIVSKLARQCEVPAITDALRLIAADEGRHAAHGLGRRRVVCRRGGRAGRLGARRRGVRSPQGDAIARARGRRGGWMAEVGHPRPRARGCRIRGRPRRPGAPGRAAAIAIALE